MKVYTKESMIDSLIEIRNRGWIKNARPGNDGGVGNTLEDLLGIEENNLPIPNAAEWELKCQKGSSFALTTLFHMEPSPRAIKFIPDIFLPTYGWKHKNAGMKYQENEMSFRQTIHTKSYSDRGFMVFINHKERKVEILFDIGSVATKHLEWRKSVIQKGGEVLKIAPYWGFDDLFHRIGNKLNNCFYIKADVEKRNDHEFYHYKSITMLKTISMDGILEALKNGDLLVDFDARTGHNHGTKFRLRKNRLPSLYASCLEI